MDSRITPRRRYLARNALVATAGAALLASGGAGVAVAAPTTHTAATVGARTPAKPPPSRFVTLRATPASVMSGRSVTLSGRTRGFTSGMKVLLQRRVGMKWMTLRNSTTLTRTGTYRFTVRLVAKGRQQLRTEVGRTFSRSVTVTVR